MNKREIEDLEFKIAFSKKLAEPNCVSDKTILSRMGQEHLGRITPEYPDELRHNNDVCPT
jgi:hypothetical protein